MHRPTLSRPHPCALLALALPAAQATPSEGFVLYAPLSARTTYLIDAQGTSVHEWHHDSPSAGVTLLLENGHLLRSARVAHNTRLPGGGQSGRIQELDPAGNIVWDFELSTERYALHHDLEPTPYGTILAIAWERRTAEEALAAGRDPDGLVEGAFWPDVIVEIEPAPPHGGTILWEWHALDHVVQERFPERAQYGSVRAHPELLDLNADLDAPAPESTSAEVLNALGYGGEPDAAARARARPPDWLHTNALAYDAEEDLLLLCARNLSEIYVIDHATTTAEAAGHSGGRRGKGGDFLARFGNPRNHGAGSAAEQRLFHAHDAHWIPRGLPGAGNVLLFNNGPRDGVLQSEVLELELPLTAPATVAWSCRFFDDQPFYASHLSAAQRLADGHTLVTIGTEARLVEVTPEGRIAWEFRHTPRADEAPEAPPAGSPARADTRPARGIFRATHLAPDHPGLARILAARR